MFYIGEIKRNLLLNFNRVHSFYNYIFLREITHSPPLYINIDLTNTCNYKCPMCPQSNSDNAIKRGFINKELFEKIISDIKELMPIEILCLFLAGEPLLNRDFELFVRLVNKKLGFRPHIASNISLLTPERIRSLIDAGLGSIIVDFCENKDIFEKYRKGASWEDTYEKLKLLIEIKKDMGTCFPKIILKDISTGVDDHNISNVRFHRLKSLFSEGDISDFQKYKFHNWGGLIENKSDIGGKSKIKIIKKYHPCSHLWFNIAIQYDGRVSACCRDFEGKLILGNVNEKSLKEIWNDKPIVNLRRSLIKGEYKDIPLCNTCDRLWTGGYFGGSPVEVAKRWIKQRPGGFKFILGK